MPATQGPGRAGASAVVDAFRFLDIIYPRKGGATQEVGKRAVHDTDDCELIFLMDDVLVTSAHFVATKPEFPAPP